MALKPFAKLRMSGRDRGAGHAMNKSIVVVPFSKTSVERTTVCAI